MAFAADASVVGRWAREPGGPCAGRYPDAVEFLEGTYLGAKGPGQGFVVWDAGIYRRTAPDRLLVQTASDELVDYGCSVTGDRLTIVDDDECEVRYRRRPDQLGADAVPDPSPARREERA